MQQSAVPELAHTHTRPIHWVATAAAVAAVVAGSSVLQPAAAQPARGDTASHTASAPGRRPAAPDAAGADYPMDCGPTKVLVQSSASGDLDGDGAPETVAVVRCDAGSGTPPNAVYVLTPDPAHGDGPRVVATLIGAGDNLTVADIAIRDEAVTATLLGYSSTDIPRCCPDRKEQARWRWQSGAFVRSTPEGTRHV